jgi:hypothetical protein
MAEAGPADDGRGTELVEKLGRNDPCPCGSGRRFRRCSRATGRFDDTRATTTPATEFSARILALAERTSHLPLAA